MGTVIKDHYEWLPLIKRGPARGRPVVAATGIEGGNRPGSGGGPLLGMVRRPAPEGSILDIRDYAATIPAERCALATPRPTCPGVAVTDLPSMPITEVWSKPSPVGCSAA